jgi:hypothetical protein
MRERKLAYMSHPVAGDAMNNIARACCILRTLIMTYPTYVVIAPWIVECEIFDEPDAAVTGMQRNRSILQRCDELWLVGPRISSGMRQEQSWAQEYGLVIRDFTNGNIATLPDEVK